MKKTNKKYSALIAIICILTLASTSLLIFNALASQSDNANTVLGTTSNFAIVAGTTITFAEATTHVVGNLAISPNAMSSVVIPAGITMVGVGPHAYGISSQVIGYIYAADGSPTISGNAQADCLTAYTTFNGWAPTSPTNYADLSGLTLNAGVYRDTANELLTTTLVLNGSSTDVWVFQIYGTFAVASGAQIILTGGAQASNIYWIVSGQTTVYPGAIFNGNVLDGTSINIQTGAQFNGRALAQAAVTMGGAVSITYPEPTPLTNTPTFYATPDGSVRLRSSIPFNFTTTDYNYTQQLLVNGDIISNLTNFGPSIPYADLGFGYTYGLLGSIVLVNNVTQSPPWGTSNVPIYGNGTFYIYAYFDTNMAGDINGNGPFFEWVNNAYLGLNGDEYGSLGPFTCNIANNYTVYITPETPIDMLSGANVGENFTLSQLQNGQPNANGFYQTDVTSNTIVGFWFGVTNETYSQQFEIYTTAPEYIAPFGVHRLRGAVAPA